MCSSSGEGDSLRNGKRGRRAALWTRLSRGFRYLYIRMVRINDSPQKVAWGMAVGVFLGIFPTFGLGIVLALALAIFFKFNKAAAIMGSLIMNPLTIPFFWTASSILGALLANRDWQRTLRMFQVFSAKLSLIDLTTREGWAFLLRSLGTGVYVYLLGNLVLSLMLAGISYFAALRLTRVYQERKRSKMRDRRSASTI